MGARPAPAWATHGNDEWFPVCPKCSKRYTDGQILDIKNYPDDGGGMLFLECEYCQVEAALDFEWKKLQPKTFTTVTVEDDE